MLVLVALAVVEELLWDALVFRDYLPALCRNMTAAPPAVSGTTTLQVSIDGEPIAWNASHLLPAGAKLTIGGARDGAYGYLHVGGGFQTPHIYRMPSW